LISRGCSDDSCSQNDNWSNPEASEVQCHVPYLV
jgi:hypothetical protein